MITIFYNLRSVNLNTIFFKNDCNRSMEVLGNTIGEVRAAADALTGAAGQVSATLRAEMVNLVGRYAATDGPNRAAQAVYSVVTSPEFALQE